MDFSSRIHSKYKNNQNWYGFSFTVRIGHSCSLTTIKRERRDTSRLYFSCLSNSLFKGLRNTQVGGLKLPVLAAIISILFLCSLTQDGETSVSFSRSGEKVSENLK